MTLRRVLAAVFLLVSLAATAGPAPTITRDLAYGDLLRQKLDLYLPAGDTGDAPLLVFFHGGGWERGTKEDISATAESLTESGLAVVVANYRLYPHAVFPQFVEDCAKAVAYAWRSLRRADGRPRRLFVSGHSAGAFNAAMIAADRHYLADAGVPAGAVAGYVLLSGPYEMDWPHMPSPYSEIFPAATRAGANVSRFIDGREPPMLLMTVDTDSVVGMPDVYHLADTVKAKDGRATLAVYRGSSDHLATFYGLSEPGSDVRKDLAAFIASATGS